MDAGVGGGGGQLRMSSFQQSDDAHLNLYIRRPHHPTEDVRDLWISPFYRRRLLRLRTNRFLRNSSKRIDVNGSLVKGSCGQLKTLKRFGVHFRAQWMNFATCVDFVELKVAIDLVILRGWRPRSQHEPESKEMLSHDHFGIFFGKNRL